jgi:hypothetical protein
MVSHLRNERGARLLDHVRLLAGAVDCCGVYHLARHIADLDQGAVETCRVHLVGKAEFPPARSPGLLRPLLKFRCQFGNAKPGQLFSRLDGQAFGQQSGPVQHGKEAIIAGLDAAGIVDDRNANIHSIKRRPKRCCQLFVV